MRVAERQREKLVDVLPHVLHTRARPVGSPQHPIADLRETRKVLQQTGRRYPGDVEPDIRVAAQNEKRLRHVERAAAMRHHDAQRREVDRHVVEFHRVAVLGARAREDAGPRMNHHGEPALLAAPIDRAEGVQAVGVGVGGKHLMRRVDLDQPDPEVHQPVHVAGGISREPRMHPAVGEQALRVRARVVRGEGVGGVGESHHVGRRVVHEPDAPHPGAIHRLEQRRRVVHQPHQEVPVRFLTAPQYLQHVRLELAPGLDVDVDVGDAERLVQGSDTSPSFILTGC